MKMIQVIEFQKIDKEAIDHFNKLDGIEKNSTFSSLSSRKYLTKSSLSSKFEGLAYDNLNLQNFEFLKLCSDV